MVEQAILNTAKHNFQTQTGLTMTFVPTTNEGTKLSIRKGRQKIEFLAEVKNELRNIHVAQLLQKIGKDRDNWLLISQYIPTPLKAELKKSGINYLEASGNCYINKDNLFLFINDRQVTPTRQSGTGKIWNAAGMKFLFAVLNKPEILNSPYRKIADIADVATGNISNYFKEMKHYLETVKKGNEKKLQIRHKKELIDKWVELYSISLMPSLHRGMFKFINPGRNHVHNDSFTPELKTHKNILWGGEPAGAILTNNLVPERFIVYSGYSDIGSTMKELKIQPDIEGNVEVRDIFWKEEITGVSSTVPPLLVYADLMNSLDGRNREIAQRIRKEFLNGK